MNRYERTRWALPPAQLYVALTLLEMAFFIAFRVSPALPLTWLGGLAFAVELVRIGATVLVVRAAYESSWLVRVRRSLRVTGPDSDVRLHVDDSTHTRATLRGIGIEEIENRRGSYARVFLLVEDVLVLVRSAMSADAARAEVQRLGAALGHHAAPVRMALPQPWLLTFLFVFSRSVVGVVAWLCGCAGSNPAAMLGAVLGPVVWDAAAVFVAHSLGQSARNELVQRQHLHHGDRAEHQALFPLSEFCALGHARHCERR